MEQFAEYGHAIASLAGMVLLWAVLNPLSSIIKEKAGAIPGGAPEADYAQPAYRWYRAYGNLVETAPFYTLAVGGAILAGASPFWVNLLASLVFVSRIAMAYVHCKGIGKASGGLRSYLFIFGWACLIALAILTIVAVF
ncbi:MAG: MAPEG family protein [Shimia sp.]|jgi:uncharacterized MAPEG superfamily protein|uniref:MAPEG family protein n=1 Tax=Shimia sp. TaxID=1954381 RepID=UPI0040596A60